MLQHPSRKLADRTYAFAVTQIRVRRTAVIG
jgi:hypothetical protein